MNENQSEAKPTNSRGIDFITAYKALIESYVQTQVNRAVQEKQPESAPIKGDK